MARTALTKRAVPGNILMGRLRQGDDLLEGLTEVCARENVTLGRIEAIGSVRRARLGYYDQQAREYRHFTLNEPLEISSLQGNVSVKEGAPFVHAHLVLSGRGGESRGGHLAPGTEVFACEFLIEVLKGPGLLRRHDDATGLQLWHDDGGGE